MHTLKLKIIIGSKMLDLNGNDLGKNYKLDMSSSQFFGHYRFQIDGFLQDCSNSIADALELLQSCTKPSK